MRWIIFSLTVAVLAAGLLLTPSCRRGPRPSQIVGHNLLFITLDTTRADRIGCYGYPKAQTPVMDALASRGVLFENAISQVPLTLPSHTSMLTGRYPREHGIRDNGRSALSKEHPTLATLFKERGYRTGAFVAAYVLESQFGLNRGFDIYSDSMGAEQKDKNIFHAQQPGNVVTDRALEWLTQKSDQPFFAWVHYYDPHDPYDPPAEFRPADGRLYDGELTFVDSQLGRIFDWLTAQGLNENTLVILAGDHGESFGEHGERGHTNFVYETNMHVPLIFAHPKVVPAGKREAAVVELVDIFPTVLELFGIESPVELMSRSLAKVFDGGSINSQEAYSESLYVFNSYGWAEQRSVTTDRWKYISSTNPELYDRRADRGETKNLVSEQSRVAADLLESLQSRFDDMPVGKADEAERSAEADQLAAGLGYVVTNREMGPEVFLSPNLRDPKEMKQVLDWFRMGRALIEQSETEEEFLLIRPLFRDITRECPDAVQFQYFYGYVLMKSGRLEEALGPLKIAYELDNTNRYAVEMAGEIQIKLGRVEEGLKNLKLATTIDPKSAQARVKYADGLEAAGRVPEAIVEYREAAKLDPELAKPYAKLCTLLQKPEEIREVAEALRIAARDLKIASNSTASEEQWQKAKAQLLSDLGICFTRIPDNQRAMEAFREAVALGPMHGPARVNLGIALLTDNRIEEAKAVFREVIGIEGLEAEGKYHLGVAFSRENNLAETVRLFEEAIAARPSWPQPIQELAMHYRNERKFADMVRVLGIGAQAQPDNVWMHNALGQMLSTCTDSNVRDCPRAVTLLEKTVAMTGRREPYSLANLCAAYACTGDFERALPACQDSLRLAEGAGDAALAARVRRQIELVGQKQPFIDERL